MREIFLRFGRFDGDSRKRERSLIRDYYRIIGIYRRYGVWGEIVLGIVGWVSGVFVY